MTDYFEIPVGDEQDGYSQESEGDGEVLYGELNDIAYIVDKEGYGDRFWGYVCSYLQANSDDIVDGYIEMYLSEEEDEDD